MPLAPTAELRLCRVAAAVDVEDRAVLEVALDAMLDRIQSLTERA
jgi:hypothetical protein